MSITVTKEGQWWVAKPATLKPGYVVVVSAGSRVSAEHAEELLRKQLGMPKPEPDLFG
jgi:outer membrane biogenesis lipoprotein LolB